MKTKRPITLLVVAFALLLLGVAFIAKRSATVQTTSQAYTLSDWAHGSAGTLNVMVSYPAEILTNQKNTITLSYETDSVLEQNLGSGYVFDAEFEASGSVITPQKRVLVPLEKGRQSISWEIVPFATFDIDGILEMALGTSALSGTYAISPQVSAELPFEVRQSSGLDPSSSFIVGLVMIGVALLCLVIYILLSRKSSGVKG